MLVRPLQLAVLQSVNEPLREPVEILRYLSSSTGEVKRGPALYPCQHADSQDWVTPPYLYLLDGARFLIPVMDLYLNGLKGLWPVSAEFVLPSGT